MKPPSVRRLSDVSALSWDDCKLLVESVTDYAIFMLHPDGRVATWNPGAERLKGYTADEIVGQHFSSFYPPEDVFGKKPERALAAARDEGRFEDESDRIRKDGTRFWASVVITALRDPDGRLRGFAKVTRDLTERRQAQLELLESEQRFHHLVDQITDYAIFMVDPSGTISSWNEGAARIEGYDADEVIGRPVSMLYAPDERKAGRPATTLETVRQSGRAEEEGWRLRKDGTRFWAHAIITALRNARGELTGFAQVIHDLTERRLAEESLHRSEERLRLLVEHAADYAIYMLEPDGRVSTWNSGAERMKGYSAAEIIGSSFSTFFPEEDRRAGKPARELGIALTEGRFSEEAWRVRKNGSRFWAHVVLTPIRNAHGELLGFAKVTRDLTFRREAEDAARALVDEQIARANAEEMQQRLRESEEAARLAAERADEAAMRAESANRMKDEFLATVSHELRTPLHAILGWSSLLSARSLEPSIADAVAGIHRNAEAQARLIDDILDAARIITGKLQLEHESVDINRVIMEAVEAFGPAAADKGITIELDPGLEPRILVGDRTRLRQVISNLLSNAVKFSVRGGTISVGVAQQGSQVTISVSDRGCGIEPDFLPHVFERFKQADSSSTRQFGGLGLGLAIVRYIVELHGGEVSADSAGKGKGAQFVVTLPIVAVAADRHDDVSLPSPNPGGAGPGSVAGLRVLVVDDDPDSRALLDTVFASAGAVVEAADSAATGFEAIRRFRPDVLVSDIGMPDEDGYSFVRRVRALSAQEGGAIPSIALTAYTREEDRAKAVAAGFDRHLGKPVNIRTLVSAVADLGASPPRG